MRYPSQWCCCKPAGWDIWFHNLVCCILICGMLTFILGPKNMHIHDLGSFLTPNYECACFSGPSMKVNIPQISMQQTKLWKQISHPAGLEQQHCEGYLIFLLLSWGCTVGITLLIWYRPLDLISPSEWWRELRILRYRVVQWYLSEGTTLIRGAT